MMDDATRATDAKLWNEIHEAILKMQKRDNCSSQDIAHAVFDFVKRERDKPIVGFYAVSQQPEPGPSPLEVVEHRIAARIGREARRVDELSEQIADLKGGAGETTENVAKYIRELRGKSDAPWAILERLRIGGWMVACHNDYRTFGSLRTFWLFTRSGRAIKGEGASDLIALRAVEDQAKLVGEETP